MLDTMTVVIRGDVVSKIMRAMAIAISWTHQDTSIRGWNFTKTDITNIGLA